VDILKESFKSVFFDMRKVAILMFIFTFLFSAIEMFFVGSAFDTLGEGNGVISSKSILTLSIIQNIKVLIITTFLCFFVTKAVSARLGAWGQVKAQFHAFFFGVFIGLIMAMIAGSLIGFFFDEATMEVQIFGITILFGLFMIIGYWHYYVMYNVRKKMQYSGVKYGLGVMAKDAFSIFKHWGYVLPFAGMSLLVMVASVAISSSVSVLTENQYASALLQALFCPLSAVVLVWYTKSIYYHYARP
jgi:hypothetical protein